MSSSAKQQNSDSQEKTINIVIRPSTSPEGELNVTGPYGTFSHILTPQNTADIQRLLREAQKGEHSFNPFLRAIGKTAITALADLSLTSATNEHLMMQNQRKHQKQKSKRNNAQLGIARVMSSETIRERQQWAITKANEKQQRNGEAVYTKEAKALLHIGLDIFQSKPLSTPRSRELAIGRKYHGHKADTMVGVQLIKYITHEVARRRSFKAISIAETSTLSLFQNR